MYVYESPNEGGKYTVEMDVVDKSDVMSDVVWSVYFNKLGEDLELQKVFKTLKAAKDWVKEEIAKASC